MKAEVYTKTVCPHCMRAKMLLKNRGIEFVEIDAVQNMDELSSRVEAAGGRPPQKVPQIFLDGQYIGGADELERHFASSELGGFQL